MYISIYDYYEISNKKNKKEEEEEEEDTSIITLPEEVDERLSPPQLALQHVLLSV
jgi:hypothetical protein